ncbi:MAG: RtcB family protein, partial [Candidatus Diapherotrites archaeon]|nr:RtcB family protein [Candidatus Diapherotrites archaeon]
GFDINCLAGSTEILHEFGYRKKIIDFNDDWIKEKIKCVDFSGKKIVGTKIKAFMRSSGKKIFKIITEPGREIIGSEDHPFYTKNGMKKLIEIKSEEVAVYPFEGADYEKPPEQILIGETDLLQNYKGNENGFRQIFNFLKSKNLIPLAYNNPKIPYLIKLLGIVQGDGTMAFLKSGKTQISVYGKKSDLETVKKDIEAIGFRANINSRMRNHEFKTNYGTAKFTFNEHSLQCGSIALALLLKCLGCTAGNKTKQEFYVPSWVMNAPKWMKRLYLAGLFGAELTTPKTVTKHGYNFYGPVLSMNKKIEIKESGNAFLGQVQKILGEFEVSSSLIKERVEFTNKKGEISVRQRLQISSVPINLIKFWSRVGFEYNEEKSFLANCAIEYLKIKEHITVQREKSILLAKELRHKGQTLKQIHQAIGNMHVNERFVARSLWEERKTAPRISMNFQKFEEFVEERTAGLGKSGQIWEKIVSIEETEFNDFVYDFNVENEHHNFIANGFVVNNCGMRLVTTNLSLKDIAPKLKELVNLLFEKVPVGVGRKGFVKISEREFKEMVEMGAKWCVEKGYGWKEDLIAIEEYGFIKGADASKISKKALQRGIGQIGTLGSGNHYLEIQVAEENAVFDKKTAKALGIKEPQQVVVMLHCGSRGFGHQTATDYLEMFEPAMKKYKISVKDPQLACVPYSSREGADYYAAMACASNNAFVNRQVIMHMIRESFSRVYGQSAESLEMKLVYDVAHNIAKVEKHKVEGKMKELIVHRKGATRSFPPGHEELQGVFKEVGQPVIVGGSMETGSYLCVGTQKAMEETFGSTMHGSGRTMSRTRAKKEFNAGALKKKLEEKGIFVKAASNSGLAEEAGGAYKNISEVVDTMHRLGISKKVAGLRPIGNIKG